MRLILESHRDICCVDEDIAYDILANDGAYAPKGTKLLGFKVPVWSEQFLERELDWNELADFRQGVAIKNFYRGEAILFMIRRAVDTVTSMSRLRVAGGTWLRRCGIPVVRNYCRKQSFREIFGADLEAALLSPEADVALGALYWKVKSLAALRYLEAKVPICLVFYEELVTTPRVVLRRVLEFLGADWDENVLHHPEQQHSGVSFGRATGGTDPSRAIDACSVGAAQTYLSGSQVEAIEKIAGCLEKALYALSDLKARECCAPVNWYAGGGTDGMQR